MQSDLRVCDQVLEEGGQTMQDAFMAEPLKRHVGIPNPNGGPLVLDRLRAAYDAALAEAADQTS